MEAIATTINIIRIIVRIAIFISIIVQLDRLYSKGLKKKIEKFLIIARVIIHFIRNDSTDSFIGRGQI